MPDESKQKNGDIVTRLRELYALYERDANELAAEEHDYCASGCPDREAAQMMQEAEIYKDAADEIERLKLGILEVIMNCEKAGRSELHDGKQTGVMVYGSGYGIACAHAIGALRKVLNG